MYLYPIDVIQNFGIYIPDSFLLKPYRTPPSSNTEMLWGCFLFLYLFLQYVFVCFFNWKIRFHSFVNLDQYFFYIYRYVIPKIWIRCLDWWLPKGHLLYGSTPTVFDIYSYISLWSDLRSECETITYLSVFLLDKLSKY